MKLANYVKRRQQHFDEIVSQFLPSEPQMPSELSQAMRYSVLGGGKRMRPLFVYAVGESMGAHLSLLDPLACSVEFIHAYSLIHDDLPAMDDADLRRGKAACHKVFGEGVAILAGNALQNLAFELIADLPQPPDLRISMMKVLNQAVGGQGILGGQMLDLVAQGKSLSLHAIEKIHRMKTSALIVASVLLGALAGGCLDVKKLSALAGLISDFGLAFQISDDIADKGERGLNYVNCLGLEKAESSMKAFYRNAYEGLLLYFPADSPLFCVMNYIK